ncbi:MAG TPA: M56 family metallopeptidase [Terriglobales bacterium]
MPHFQSLANFFASGLLSSLVLGTVIAVAAWAFLRLSGTQSSRARFAVWFSTLLLVFILPLLSWISSGSAAPETHSGLRLPAFVAIAIFAVWIIGASLALLRVGFAFHQSIRLRATSHQIESKELADIAASLTGNFRGAELRLSNQVNTPTAIGFFRPVILIPSWALNELSSNELQAILIHELEHLRRWDDWTNFAQKVVSALFFFHPAIWWMDRNLALEREIACDDAVLARTPDRHAYAACLLRVAEKSLLHKGLALAQAIIGRVGQTTLRITQILAGARPAKHVFKPAAYILAAGSLSSVLFLAQTPLVSFESELPSLAQSASSENYANLASERESAPPPHLVMAGFREPETASNQPLAPTRSKAPNRISTPRALQSARVSEDVMPSGLTEARFLQAQLIQAQLIQAQFLQEQMFAAHARFIESLLTDAPAPFVLMIQQDPRQNEMLFVVWHAGPAPHSMQRIIPARKI